MLLFYCYFVFLIKLLKWELRLFLGLLLGFLDSVTAFYFQRN